MLQLLRKVSPQRHLSYSVSWETNPIIREAFRYIRNALPSNWLTAPRAEARKSLISWIQHVTNGASDHPAVDYIQSRRSSLQPDGHTALVFQKLTPHKASPSVYFFRSTCSKHWMKVTRFINASEYFNKFWKRIRIYSDLGPSMVISSTVLTLVREDPLLLTSMMLNGFTCKESSKV